MNKLYFLMLAVFCCMGSYAQILEIPDADFKNALVNLPCAQFDEDPLSGFFEADTNDDGEIDVSEALAVKVLQLNDKGIHSLEGIAHFENLKALYCKGNLLSDLDVSNLAQLRTLFCGQNNLTSLALNSPVNDYTLIASQNLLSTIDLKSNGYHELQLSQNQLTSVDASLITGLDVFVASENPLTNLTLPELDGVTGQDWMINDLPLTSFKVPFPVSGLFIGAMPTLVSLDLSRLRVSEISYITMMDLPGLRYLNLKNGEVDVCGTTPEGIYLPCNEETDGGEKLDFAGGVGPLQYICVDNEQEGEQFKMLHDPNVQYSTLCTFSPGGEFNTINGNIQMTCGNSGIAMSHIKVQMTGPESATVFSDADGQFTTYALQGNFTIAPMLENPSYFTVTPESIIHNFTGLNTSISADFCLTPNGVHHDLGIAIVPLADARPGFDARYAITYTNNGTETESGTIALAFPEVISDFLAAEPSPSSQNPDAISWNFTGLTPFETRQILFSVNINSPIETPAVNIDDVLAFSVEAVVADEETPADNTNLLNQIVVGAYDPNDKAVSSEVIAPSQTDDYLVYTIRFQNTGNFPAETVMVHDRISDNLDISTLQMVSASHDFRTRLDGSNLEVIFEDIQLPGQEQDEPQSHGYFTFRIKPAQTLSLGDAIQNTAAIYFDFNAPVITNTVGTAVAELGLGQHQAGAFSVSPNPAGEIVSVTVDSLENATATIFDLSGKKLSAQRLEAGTKIDVSGLPSGCYLIRITSDSGMHTLKFIKK